SYLGGRRDFVRAVAFITVDATLGPCFRAAFKTCWRCFGGRRRQMSHAVSATVTGPRRLLRRGTGLSSHRHYLSCPLSRSLSFALALSLPLPRSSPWPLSASGCSCAGAEGCGIAGVTGGTATGVCAAGGQAPLSSALLSLSGLAFTFSFPCPLPLPLPLLCCGGAGSGVGVAGV